MFSASQLFRTVLSALVAATLAVPLAAAPLASAHAQTMASEPVMRRTIHVPRDKSLSFRLPGPASKIVVAQPEIAKVTATSNASFYVQGIEFGATNMLVYGRGGQLVEVIDVRVGFDSDGLQQDLSAAFPGEAIQVRNLGEMLMLGGHVTDTGVQLGAERIAEKFAPDAVISRLTVKESQQVILEVRIIEADRTAMQDVGFNFSAINPSFSFATGQGLIGIAPPNGLFTTSGGSGATSLETALGVLEQRGMIRTLARPNLVAISGEKASFLAGGEFPFPVPEDLGKIVIQFRQYGVKLNFTPTVQTNGWVKLAVEPEVSQLDPNNSLTVLGITVPALTVRRASTTLELKPGDTFVMAGLFQRNLQTDVDQTPWLADVPVLGALFRSSRWKRSETELMIIVTPRLATAEDRAAPKLDAIPGKEPSAKDLQLFGRALDQKVRPGDPTPLGRN
ncbi:type II and III secretion system protein family protein [uncultured Phenylobacterium sp.]|uniref:type II and III secretion system protein family protein n=1 Tax=uncultured Phenylobacterium sp. TaxID=349273 RepID=UPI0025D1DAFA|nr:type II and III secretion system protein family protein [uncultured Phenylobacterium sp.]